MFAIAALLQLVCWALLIAIFIRVAWSWIRPSDPWRAGNEMANPIYRVSYTITEPILAPVRRLMPGGGMGMDFSPMIVSFLIFMVMGMLRGL